MHLPYIGNVSTRFEKAISQAVGRCFGSVSVLIHFSSRSMLPKTRKDRLSILSRSKVIYKFLCHCRSAYIGKTTQRLRKRIDQHVPSCFRNRCANRAIPSASSCSSAIAEHLCSNDACGRHYDDSMFTIVSSARNQFHLDVLEACYIGAVNPVLCKKKQFVYSTCLPVTWRYLSS